MSLDVSKTRVIVQANLGDSIIDQSYRRSFMAVAERFGVASRVGETQIEVTGLAQLFFNGKCFFVDFNTTESANEFSKAVEEVFRAGCYFRPKTLFIKSGPCPAEG